MKIKVIELCNGDSVDFASLLDEFNIPRAQFDIRKLLVTYDEDWSGCYYAGETPVISLTVQYNE